MTFSFHPKHEFACPKVSHCPHLGGASLGTLVLAANSSDATIDRLYRQLDAARESISKLVAENESHIQEIERLKLELKLERQNKFATNRQRQAGADQSRPTEKPSQIGPRKRGAPVGHPGWFRPTPTEYDAFVEVAAPAACPHCGGPVRFYPSQDPSDHLQEDLIERCRHVTLFRHPAARCRTCRRWVQKAGDGEILGSMIGPRLRAIAVYLHTDIGMSLRKVRRTIEDLFDFRFTAAALIGFEKLLAVAAESVVDDIRKKIAASDGAVHADETYWVLDGQRAYYWVHATDQYIHFQFDTSRSGEVSRDVLGVDFAGTLVTDCYSAYDAQVAKAKQKCLSHLARTARDWQKLTCRDSDDYRFFESIQQWVKRGCGFHRRRDRLSVQEQAEEKAWLRLEFERLQNCPLGHDKAVTLQERINRYADCWLVFLDDPRVPPTNNHAERCLRPLVILRKITFGHRTRWGATTLARLMTIQESAKRHGHRVLDVLSRLATVRGGFPDAVMRYIYAGPCMAGT
jgi:regulator of replication initiation timing